MLHGSKENSMLVKRIQACTHLSSTVYTSYSEILVGNRNFFLPTLRLTPPYRVAPGTIAVNVTRLERGFNAYKTPRCIYPSIFNRFPVIQAWNLKVRHLTHFLHILTSTVYAPATIAVNVTRIEREFNACQTTRSMYSSVFNRFWDIASYWSKIAIFSDPTSV